MLFSVFVHSIDSNSCNTWISVKINMGAWSFLTLCQVERNINKTDDGLCATYNTQNIGNISDRCVLCYVCYSDIFPISRFPHNSHVIFH